MASNSRTLVLAQKGQVGLSMGMEADYSLFS